MKEGEGGLMLESDRKRFVIAGATGLIGSALCKRLEGLGHYVYKMCRSNGFNISHNAGVWVLGEVDYVIHLASFVSPREFMAHPLETLDANSIGTVNLCSLATVKKARFMYVSSARVYRGEDPTEERALYEQGKRYGEALTSALQRNKALDTCIVRLWQTYGPGCKACDGHVIPTFIRQALKNEPLELLGGVQVGYFNFVEDIVSGILKVLFSKLQGPIDIGGQEGISVFNLASKIINLCESRSRIYIKPFYIADERRPNTQVLESLGWKPKVSLDEGLPLTIEYLKKVQNERVNKEDSLHSRNDSSLGSVLR